MRRHHFELVTETFPPEVNGVALTVQALAAGLRELGHGVGLVRPRQAAEVATGDPRLLLAPGAPIPRYPGLRFGLPIGARLRERWTLKRPDAVYIATEGPLGWSALRICRRLGLPVATGFHTRFDDYVGRYGAGFLSPWVMAWMRGFHNRADATLVPTRQLQSQLRERGFERVEVIGRGIDTRQFHPDWRCNELRQQWEADDSAKVVIHVGRIAPEKNLELAVRAFRELQRQQPQARMVWVGDGPAREALQRAHPDFVFAGMLRGDALARHYASADLFCFPSLSETFGNVTLEAMASGLPCVAFDYGAAREHLRDGEHGAVVSFGDADAFVAALLQQATRSDLRAAGLRAREAVLHLHPERICGQFARLLSSLEARSAAA